MKRKNVLNIIVATLLLMSCSKEDEGSKISLDFSTKTLAKSSITKNLNTNVVFTDFKISIRDVIFKNDDDPNSNLDTDEIQFRGPYQIDLLEGGDAISKTIGEVLVPDGLYKEMRFKFHKDENLPTTDKLYDRSIYIEGTIDGVPFVFWHDTSENLDVGRSTGIKVQNNIVDFTVHFDISQFMSSLHQLDLSEATDNNEDGLIEIFPNDEDGNQELAKKLKENIKAAANLLH